MKKSPSESFCFCLFFIVLFYRVRPLMSTQQAEVSAALLALLRCKSPYCPNRFWLL